MKETLVKEGIKQTVLAKAIGMSDGTINKICNQTYNPSNTTKHRILIGLHKLTGKEFSISQVFPDN